MSNFRVNCNPDRSSICHFDHPKDFRRLVPRTILKCGHGTGAGPFLLDKEDRHHDRRDRRTIASVTLDTRKLFDTTIKIDFCSIISFEADNDHNHELRLVFRLIKICKDEESKIPLGEWVFERAIHRRDHYSTGLGKAEDASLKIPFNNDNELEESDSFCFSWCECEEEECDRCRYIVEIVRQEGHDVRVNINNAILTALAVGCEEI
ncbi:MAG TPA: hypothetical protein DD811_03210 [Syntrophomonas sp.]|nr:hypothetical protein [Syntrophomonas sp.]